MIIAVDPGLHTGLAFRLDNTEWATLMAENMPDPNERLRMVLDTLYKYTSDGRCVALVIEEFKTMGYVSKFGIETIELVGAIKALCMLNHVPMVRQTPQHRLPYEKQAKALVVERSRKTKLPITDHEVSALAHLLYYESTLARPAKPTAVSTGPDEHRTVGGPITMNIKPVANVERELV